MKRPKAEKTGREALLLALATLLALALIGGAALAEFAPLWGTVGDGDPPPLEDSIRVNLNTADLYDLCRLPGVSTSIAFAILEYRAANGPIDMTSALEGVGGLDIRTILHWGNMAYTQD